MKAVVYNKYGSTNRIRYVEVERPVVKDDEVLVEVHAVSINQADVSMLLGKPFPLRFMTGLFRPKHKIMGSDISGVIKEIGNSVKVFKVGDEVFGELEINEEGGLAEYAAIKTEQLTKKPKNVSHSEASSVTMAALTALQGLRLANLKEGSNVLIYGASGGVGTFMIQVAKAVKAKVTAVCSTRNITVAKESGADVIIDYKKEKWNNQNKKYDVIIAANGYNKLKVYRDALVDDGIYVISGGTMKQIMEVFLYKPFMRKKGNKQFLNYVAKTIREDLIVIANMLEKGEIRPHIDKEFPIEESNLAFDHFIAGKTIGKTVIKIK